MAKMEKTSKKKGNADLEDMRDAFARQKARAAGGGGGGGKNDYDKLGDGKNMRRILPRESSEMRKFYTEGWTHFDVGPNKRAIRCIDEAHINVERGLPESGTKCPLCKKFLREQSRINSEYKKGDKDGHAEWKLAKDKYVPRHQFYANVLRLDDDGDAEVVILAFGMQVWTQLMNYYLGDDTSIGDFTDPEGGRWMNIKKEKKGGRDRRNVEYKVFPASDSSDISDSWDDIKEGLHDLEAAAGTVQSADEVVAIMKGIDLDKGSDDGDDDDDDSSDDSSSKSRKKKTSKKDDDDDDDASDSDSGEESEDEEEEEEERPAKKSKLSVKMKKRRDD